MADQTKIEWVTGLLKGDRAMQKSFYFKYYNYVRYIAQQYGMSDTVVQETINDVFLTIFTKIHSFDSNFPFEPWIRKITVNKCIDKHRKFLKGLQTEQIDAYPEVGYNTPEYEFEKDRYENIREVIHQIPERYRVIFNLYVFEDYSHKEIADKLGIAVGTSKSALSRAKSIIRRHYEQKKRKNEGRTKAI